MPTVDDYRQNSDGTWSLKKRDYSSALSAGTSLVSHTKQQHDIVDVIGAYVNLRKATRSEYIGRCPFHEDRHPSLNVSSDKQKFHCFGCHHKGDVIDFISQIEDLDTKQACLFLGKGLDKLYLTGI